jgi:hypothetical protein
MHHLNAFPKNAAQLFQSLDARRTHTDGGIAEKFAARIGFEDQPQTMYKEMGDRAAQGKLRAGTIYLPPCPSRTSRLQH